MRTRSDLEQELGRSLTVEETATAARFEGMMMDLEPLVDLFRDPLPGIDDDEVETHRYEPAGPEQARPI